MHCTGFGHVSPCSMQIKPPGHWLTTEPSDAPWSSIVVQPVTYRPWAKSQSRWPSRQTLPLRLATAGQTKQTTTAAHHATRQGPGRGSWSMETIDELVCVHKISSSGW